MKILVLMPLDERYVYIASKLYSCFSDEVKEKVFMQPMFMQYAVSTKVAPNWAASVFQTIIAAQSIYRAAENDDLIIVGNIDKKYEFDAVFNFQDSDEDLPYNDKNIEKLKEINDETLRKVLSNLYTTEDSKMPLHNYQATADFLSAYLQTDPHLDIINKEYEETIRGINGTD